MRTLPMIAGVVATVSLISADACGQVTVQLPEVQTFGVNTTVVVPDRGAVLLGSVKSARDSRFDSIFSPIGSNVGSERSVSSMWVTVQIHDFEEMERELARQAEIIKVRRSSIGSNYQFQNHSARQAWSSLQGDPVRASDLSSASDARPLSNDPIVSSRGMHKSPFESSRYQIVDRRPKRLQEAEFARQSDVHRRAEWARQSMLSRSESER